MAELIDYDTTDANNTARWPENMQFREVNNAARANEGIMARWLADNNGTVTASGSSNAFAVTSNQTISSYYNGLTFVFKANHNITGAATLNVSGLGAKSLRTISNADLRTGEIVNGQMVSVVYQATSGVFQVVSPIGYATGVQGALEVGTIMAYPTNSAPSGWLHCNGQAVSRTTYSELYATIGVWYGNGDGSTTFNVPDYRGWFLRGWDNGTGSDVDAASRTDRGDGTTGDNVGTHQDYATEIHQHDVGALSSTISISLPTDSQGAHTHSYYYSVVNNGFSGGINNNYVASSGSAYSTSSSGAHTHTATGSAGGGNITGFTGTSGATLQESTETRPKNKYVMWCILAVPTPNASETKNPQSTPSANVTLANGDNNNVATSSSYKLRVQGPSAAFAITGIAAADKDGAIMRIYNPVAQDMTLKNENASSTAANRITTLTGADVTLTGVSAATLVYDLTDARWILFGTQG